MDDDPGVIVKPLAGVRAAGALGAVLKEETVAEVVGIEIFEEAADLAETRLDAVLRLDLQRLDRTHVHFFTLEEIGELLDSTGFDMTALEANRLEEAPPQVASLAQFATQFGAGADDVLRRLNAYQYIVAARRRP
jgi:hypothetical protein